MAAIRTGLTAFAALALLGGCVAQVPLAEVTRFHLGQPVTRGQIAIQPRDGVQPASLAYENYASSIARELKAQGFAIAGDPARAELVALIGIDRTNRMTGPARSPFSIGIGGGTGGSGFGVGGGVSFPIGKATAPEATRTELFVQIKRRGDSTPIWEGRGRLEARSGTPYASPAAAVDKLAAALFKDLPGESGRTITVR